jgi:hypothetical protein
MKIACLMVGSTLSIALLVGGAQAQYGAPWLSTIDQFNTGPASVNFVWPTSFAVQQDQGGLNTLGGFRLYNGVALAPNTTFPSTPTGSLAINTSAGTYSWSVTPAANQSTFTLMYRGRSLGTISGMMANLNFPGVHGVGLDIINLTAPVQVRIELATVGATGGAGAFLTTTLTPPSDGQPFRFRTTWDQYTYQPGFTLNQVDQIAIMFVTTANTANSITLDSIGIAPSPGAASVLGLGLVAATRRRRTA